MQGAPESSAVPLRFNDDPYQELSYGPVVSEADSVDSGLELAEVTSNLNTAAELLYKARKQARVDTEQSQYVVLKENPAKTRKNN